MATFGPTAQAFLATAQSGVATFGPTGQAFLATAQAGLASAVPITLPGATPAPNGFASGGLGLARAAWEAQHGSGGDAGGGFFQYEEKTYIVGYGGDRIQHLERSFNPAISLDEARTQSKPFLPADSQFVKTFTAADGSTADLYNSPSLAVLVPTTNGGCTALYRQSNESVTSVVLGLGNNP